MPHTPVIHLISLKSDKVSITLKKQIACYTVQGNIIRKQRNETTSNKFSVVTCSDAIAWAARTSQGRPRLSLRTAEMAWRLAIPIAPMLGCQKMKGWRNIGGKHKFHWTMILGEKRYLVLKTCGNYKAAKPWMPSKSSKIPGSRDPPSSEPCEGWSTGGPFLVHPTSRCHGASTSRRLSILDSIISMAVWVSQADMI